MTRKIYQIIDNQELVEFDEERYKNENDFQRLISEYPDLIPGDQIDSDNPRKWLLVGREINNIDILLLDQDGIPTIIEVKKSNNNEIHREVVGQMLDYGSNLILSQSLETIRSRIQNNGPNYLQDSLGKDINEDEFWKKLKMNLDTEMMRLIVVSDEIPRNLQNIIEFLNNKTESMEVLGLEIKHYLDESGKKTFVPRLVGQIRNIVPFEPELKETTFFDNLDDVGVDFYRELIDFADENNLEKKWTKTGFFLTVPMGEDDVKILHCYSGLYSFGQNVFSTHQNITNDVKNGSEIFEQCLMDILELDDFFKVNNGFGFKIEKNLEKRQWEEFKRILTETKEKIEINGLAND